MRFVSHSQNFEDVLLYRALRHVEGGFYVDVGAQDPVVDSVSLAFYERGWRGVHIEPSPQFAARLREHRPDEVVLQFAVGAVPGSIRFFEIPETGLSTAEESVAVQHREAGFTAREITVECRTLTELLAPYRGRDVHWMKIDVEGMEREVIEGWDRRVFRPWVVVVEATEPLSEVRAHAQWEPMLLEDGFQFAFFDGLNRYYVAAERSELLASFDRPANVFDNFALSGIASNSFSALLTERIGELEGVLQNEHLRVADATRRLEASEAEGQRRLQASEAEGQRLVAHIGSQQGEIDRLKQYIAEQQDEATRLNEWMVAQRREVAHLNEHIRSLDGEVARLKRHIDWQQREWDAVRTEAAARTTEVEAMSRSLSWRMTGPLRRLNAIRMRGMRYPRRVLGSVRRVARAPAQERPTHIALWLMKRPALLAVVETAARPFRLVRTRLDQHLALARALTESARTAALEVVAPGPIVTSSSWGRPMTAHAASVLRDLRNGMNRL